MSEQRIAIQGVVDFKEAEPFTKEYFCKDTIIFMDVFMLKVRYLRNIIENNLFFNNSIWIPSGMMKTVQELMLVEEKSIKCQNAYIFFQLWERNKDKIRIINIKKEEEFSFLQQHAEIVLYTSSEKKQELAKKKEIRVRLYGDYNGADRYKPQSLNFETLGCAKVDEETQMYYIAKKDDVSKKETEKIVYNRENMGNVEYLIKNERERQYIEVGDLVIIKVRKDRIFTFIVYFVANNHSKHNVIKLLWTDIPIQGMNDWTYVPKRLIPFLQAEL